MKSSKSPHVVIIGGGFGGLSAARALRRAKARITLIDRRNHHLFQPLLYQVASAGLNPGDIAYPIRSVLRRHKNARVLLGEVTAIDRDAKVVYFEGGEIVYDYLIVATGATHSYFGNDQWSEHAPGLKSIEDALEIRRKVLLAYEAAERETDPTRRAAWMTFVVVGGGATGVELAGVLAEISTRTLARDFRKIDSRNARVVLLEGGDRVLAGFPESLSTKAERQLVKLGVEVKTGAMVTSIDEGGVMVGDDRIEAHTTLWAAGVKASPLAETLGTELDRAGRVRVTERLHVPGDERVFVVGDLAALEQNGQQLPGVAQVAIQGARFVARRIKREIRGKTTDKTFRYNDRGSLATIGRTKAVAHIGRLKLSGFLAWMIWWAVHIAFLIGFRSKVMVMFGWMYNFLTFGRGARLITGDLPRLPPTGRDTDSRDHGPPDPADIIRFERSAL